MKRFIRNGKSIETITTDAEGVENKSTEQFKSLNKARRQSRILQQANGGLGCGVLVSI